MTPNGKDLLSQPVLSSRGLKGTFSTYFTNHHQRCQRTRAFWGREEEDTTWVRGPSLTSGKLGREKKNAIPPSQSLKKSLRWDRGERGITRLIIPEEKFLSSEKENNLKEKHYKKING